MISYGISKIYCILDWFYFCIYCTLICRWAVFGQHEYPRTAHLTGDEYRLVKGFWEMDRRKSKRYRNRSRGGRHYPFPMTVEDLERPYLGTALRDDPRNRSRVRFVPIQVEATGEFSPIGFLLSNTD